MCSHKGGTDKQLQGMTEIDVHRRGRTGAALPGFPCEAH